MLSQTGVRGRRPGSSPFRARLISAARDQRRGGGHLLKLAVVAGISATAARKLMSQMRTSGLARCVHVYVPAKLGRVVEARTYVSLSDNTPETLDHFERRCCADPAVATAAFISGRFSYVITSFHRSEEEAFGWTRAMSVSGNVHDVKTNIIATKFGHLFDGIPLWG